MEVAEGNHNFTMKIADQQGDSPCLTDAEVTDRKRQKLTDLGSESDNILYQNQQMIQVVTGAARTSATTANLLGDVFEICCTDVCKIGT